MPRRNTVRPSTLLPALAPCTLVMAASLATSGCRDSGVASGTTVVGDTTVVFSAEPVLGDTARLRLVQRYGTLDGPVDETFTRVGRIAVDDAGRVYASDDRLGVKTFAPDGRFAGWLARGGEGPADVGAVHALATHGDSLVAVYDASIRRIKVFLDGELSTTHDAPDGMRRYGEDALLYDRGGRLWVGVVPGYEHDPTLASEAAIFVQVGEGASRDSVALPARYRADCPLLRERDYSIGFWADTREPWVAMPKWALGPDGRTAFGCPAEFRFDVILLDGSVRRIEIPHRPAPWLDGEVAQFAADYEFDASIVGDRPAYTRILLAPDGRTWVWPSPQPERIEVPQQFREIAGADTRWSVGEVGAFEVFGDDGRWHATVRLPDELRYSGFPTEPPVVIRGDTIWGVTVDEFDVEYVSRYVVEWAGG